MSKKIKINTDLIGQIGKTSKSLLEKKGHPQFSDDLLIGFPFNIKKTKLEFLRMLVVYKRTLSPNFFHYSNTDAVREGIQALRELNPNIEQRPNSVKFSTRNGTLGRLNGVEKKKTTFSISENDKEFIYNFIYEKSKKIGEYGKAEFFDELLEELRKKYPKAE